MTDGIQQGWQNATWALGWLLAALPALIVLALLTYGAVYLVSIEIPHQVAVHRIRRQTRASGRRS